MALKQGHVVLRLPPYHCIFNAIEHVWSISKRYYNKHVGRDGRKEADCLALWQEALSTVTPEIWSNCIRHTENEIEKWWRREKRIDHVDAPPLLIQIGNTDNSSDSEELE